MIKGRTVSREQKRIIGDDRARLMSKFQPQESGCWIWMGRLHPAGYGTVRLGDRIEQAHRAVWKVFVGPIPNGAQLNHVCHHRACVNPAHLYIGDQKQNMDDMYRAKRQNPPRGRRNHAAKLTEDQVSEIRRITGRLKPGVGQELARRFGVSQSLVRQVRNGRAWRWL